MKQIALLILFAMAAISAFAQNMQEVVYLKNGSIIRGLIIEQKPNESLKVQTTDGNVFVFEMKDIERITKETAAIQRNDSDDEEDDEDEDDNDNGEIKYPRLGYRGFVDITAGWGWGENDEEHINNFVRSTISTVHGMQFNRKLFIGGGLAYQEWEEIADWGDWDFDETFTARTIAIFADARCDFLAMKCSPYVDMRLGGYAGDLKGFYFRPTVGARIKRFNVYLGFEFQPHEYRTPYYHIADNNAAFVFGVAFDWGARK